MKKNILTILILTIMANFACIKHQTAEATTPPADSVKVKTFQKININDLKFSPDSLLSRGWFIVSAGDSTNFNEMTISWGAFGTVWALPTVTIYIRNTRYTYQFLENNKYFTLCAFGEEYREKLEFIGTKSGRDIDKVAATGLTPRFTALGTPYFEEAWLVIECEKIYWNDIDRKNLFAEAQKMYTDPKETHRMYIGGIVNVWEKR